MESFMKLASANLNLRYECAKCASELGLSNPVGLTVKHIMFPSIEGDLIEIRPLTSIRTLCGALGSKLRLSCRACKAKLGYRLDSKFEINTEAINIALGEVQLQMVAELGAGTEGEPGEGTSSAGPGMEEIIEPDEFRGMSRTDLVQKLRQNLRVGADMEMEIDRIKEENMSFNSIIKDLERENMKSSERSVIMIKRIEYLNTKIERMKDDKKEREDELNSLIKQLEGECLKGGERAIAFMRRIQQFESELDRMKEKRKESEEEFRKGRQKNLSLVLKMEKMKQRIRETEREFKLEMECLNISLQRAKVIGEKRLQELKRHSNKYLRAPIGRNEPEKESLVLDSEKNARNKPEGEEESEMEQNVQLEPKEKAESDTFEGRVMNCENQISEAIKAVEERHQPEPELSKKGLAGEGSGKNKRKNRKKRKTKAGASRAP